MSIAAGVLAAAGDLVAAADLAASADYRPAGWSFSRPRLSYYPFSAAFFDGETLTRSIR